MDTCRHLQTGKGIDRLLRRRGDIDQSLMGSLLKLFSGILVLMNSPEDRDHFFPGGKRNRTGNLCSALADRLDDLLCALINQLMIISLQCDTHYLICHKKSRLLIRSLLRQAVTVHASGCFLFLPNFKALQTGLVIDKQFRPLFPARAGQ